MAQRGRPKTSTCLMVEECVELSVFELDIPADPLCPAPPVTVTTTWLDGAKVYQMLSTTTTSPHYGGFRPWLLCPKCDGRYGKLYAHEGHQEISL